MGFRLAISDVIDVSVKLSVTDQGKRQQHAFVLLAKRMDAEPLREALNDGALSVRGFLQERIVGWRDQRLVVDEDSGAPAAFSLEALDALLSVAGIEKLALDAYLVAVVAADGVAARAKN